MSPENWSYRASSVGAGILPSADSFSTPHREYPEPGDTVMPPRPVTVSVNLPGYLLFQVVASTVYVPASSVRLSREFRPGPPSSS